MRVDQFLKELTYLKKGMVNLTGETAKDFFDALVDACLVYGDLNKMLDQVSKTP
jgi:hypothetical protein